MDIGHAMSLRRKVVIQQPHAWLRTNLFVCLMPVCFKHMFPPWKFNMLVNKTCQQHIQGSNLYLLPWELSPFKGNSPHFPLGGICDRFPGEEKPRSATPNTLTLWRYDGWTPKKHTNQRPFTSGGIWRIIPFSKWLITMVSKSPSRVIPLPSGLKMAYKWGLLTTY